MPKFSPGSDCGCCSGVTYPAWTVRHENVSDKLHFYVANIGNASLICQYINYFYDSEVGNEITYRACDINQNTCVSFSGESYIVFEKTNVALTGYYPQTWIKANRIKRWVISGNFPYIYAGANNLELTYDSSKSGYVFGGHFQGINGITGALTITSGSLNPSQPYVCLTPMIAGRVSSLGGTSGQPGTQITYGTGMTVEITGHYNTTFYVDSGRLNSSIDLDIISFRSYSYSLDVEFNPCNYYGTGANPTAFSTSYGDSVNYWRGYNNGVTTSLIGAPFTSPLVSDLGIGYPTFLSGLMYSTYSYGNSAGGTLSVVEQTTNGSAGNVGSSGVDFGVGTGILYKSCAATTASYLPEPFSPNALEGAFKKILEYPILSAYGIRHSGSGSSSLQYNLMLMSNTGTRHILEEWNLVDYTTISGSNFYGYLPDYIYNPSLTFTAINQYIVPSSDFCV